MSLLVCWFNSPGNLQGTWRTDEPPGTVPPCKHLIPELHLQLIRLLDVKDVSETGYGAIRPHLVFDSRLEVSHEGDRFFSLELCELSGRSPQGVVQLHHEDGGSTSLILRRLVTCRAATGDEVERDAAALHSCF